MKVTFGNVAFFITPQFYITFVSKMAGGKVARILVVVLF